MDQEQNIEAEMWRTAAGIAVAERDRLRATVADLVAALEAAEDVIGGNLVWIADQADLGIRQKNPETLRRLAELDGGWNAIVAALAKARAGS